MFPLDLFGRRTVDVAATTMRGAVHSPASTSAYTITHYLELSDGPAGFLVDVAGLAYGTPVNRSSPPITTPVLDLER